MALYDLQAVLLCQAGDISSFYYVSKVNVHNLTITSLQKKQTKKQKDAIDATCFEWHEGQAGRCANEI